jgi:uncharacterized protein YycO
MSYAVVSLQPGDVILVEGRSWLDRLIRWATASPFSHAALVGDGVLVEANWPTVRKVPLDAYAANGRAYRVQATDEQRRGAVAAALSRVGQPYGLEELLVADAARYLLHVILRLRPTYLTCSHLVAWAYRRSGVVLTWAPYPSPADLAESPILVGPRPWQEA